LAPGAGHSINISAAVDRYAAGWRKRVGRSVGEAADYRAMGVEEPVNLDIADAVDGAPPSMARLEVGF
jgi:hypothetical protein